MFDATTGKIQKEIPDITGQVTALSPDGKRVAAQQSSRLRLRQYGPIRVHDLETGSITTMQGWCVWVLDEENPQCKQAPKTPFQQYVWNLDFSPDGALLDAGGQFPLRQPQRLERDHR